MTVMGDAFMEELSDRVPIPLKVHTCKTAENEMIQRFFEYDEVKMRRELFALPHLSYICI